MKIKSFEEVENPLGNLQIVANLSENEFYPNQGMYGCSIWPIVGHENCLKSTENSESDHLTFQRRIKNSNDRF